MHYRIPVPLLYQQMARDHGWGKAKYTEFVEAYLRKSHPRMRLVEFDQTDAICERRE